MSQPILEIKDLNTFYGPIQALRGVSLEVNTGEIVTLIGANGAGKSTLLLSIFGSPRAHSGQILYKGDDLRSVPTHKIAKMGVALVPEGRRVFSGMTVEENLLMGATPIGMANAEADIKRIWEFFPRLLERRNQRAVTMSGGEQQMVAIGRALMGRPDLLLLDEPSLGLAPIIVKQIFAKLREISSEGTTVFLVEQNANHALKLANRGYVMVNGEIRLTGTGEELLANDEVREAYLGGH